MNKNHGEYNTGHCIEPRGLMRDLVHGARTSQMASDASGSEFYWRVSRVDKPCEETMRVGVCAAPHKRIKKGQKEKGRYATEKRAVAQEQRRCDREEECRAEHARDATP